MIIKQVPPSVVNAQEHRRQMATAINLLIQSVSLRGNIAFGSSPIIISDDRIGSEAIVLLMPQDSSAASATYSISVTPGQATINYTGTGSFKYLIIL